MLGGSILVTPCFSPSTTLVTITFGCRGCLGFLALSLVAFEFVTLALFHLAFVLVVTTFAKKPTGDGTPVVIVMVHCFSILTVLLSFPLQHATNAMITVRAMTRPPLVIDRFTVQEWEYTCLGFHLIHGT